jgi:hypothetical protein
MVGEKKIHEGTKPTEYDKKKDALDQRLAAGTLTQAQYDEALFGIKPTEGTSKTASGQIKLTLDSIDKAIGFANASGRAGWKKTVGNIFSGSTKYTELEALTNTIRTNVLTLSTDPTIKKFFGPQMSEADVMLMTSAGTTLNPELQGPDSMKTELERLKDLMTRMKESVSGGEVSATEEKIVNGQTYIKVEGGWELKQ